MILRELINLHESVLLGTKEDITATDRFVAMSFADAAIVGKVHWHHLGPEGEVYVYAQEVDDELLYVTQGGKHYGLSNEYISSNPILMDFNKKKADEQLEALKSIYPDARLMTLAEAMAFEPVASLVP